MTVRTLGIPVLNRGDLLLRCVQSVDRPVDLLVIVNNGVDPGVRRAIRTIERRELPNAELFTKIRIDKQPKNLGCGPSWNHVLKSSDGPWFFIGSDVAMKPGSFARVIEVVDRNPDAAIVCADGYNAFVLTGRGVVEVGYFDENFYPAYFEDCDHFHRVGLVGARAVGVPGFEFVHGEAPHWGSSTINSDPALNAKNGVTFTNNLDYYVRKWGGRRGEERFGTPFDRPVSPNWWELDPELRRRNDIWRNR